MLTTPDALIRIGDTARFPLGRLGDETVYRHLFEVTAFRQDGCIVLARRHDGFTRTIARYWFEKYRTLESQSAYYDRKPHAGNETIAHGTALDQLRARRLQTVRLQTDPTVPGFYVSALERGGSTGRYALLLGPFVDHYTALQFTRLGHELVRPYDAGWNDIAVGTCKVASSACQGKFNHVFSGATA